MEIAIRKFERNDVDAFLQAVRESTEHMSPWLPWCDDTYDLASAQQ